MAEDIDLGHGHTMRWLSWSVEDLAPNRERYPDLVLPFTERAGAIVEHPDLKHPGETCMSAVHFDGTTMARFYPSKNYWKVESWDPLTISPSLLCLRCGDHGFIRQGKWVPA